MANITGTNNNDTLFGTAFSDVIKGLAGADSMAGGKGSDVYYVDNAGDTVTETVNGGYDTIYSSIDLSLALGFDNIEKVVLQDGALNVRGNDLNNTLVGNAGENSLRGDGGNDTLIGGAGNDFYIVETLGDKIVEKAGGGHDEVMALGDYSLAAFAQVEACI
jgi:Ca2+-binding RTX toxin-like protein